MTGVVVTTGPSATSESLMPALRWAAIALLLTALVASAAYWGYRSATKAPDATLAIESAAAAANRAGAVAATSRSPQSEADNAAQRRASNPSTLPRFPAMPGSGNGKTLAWPLWEFQLRQPIPPRDPALTPPPWKMIGAAQSSGVWSIIILRQGKTTPEYYKVGDTLPGGYRVDAITEEDVTLLQGRRSLILSYIGSR